MQRKYGNTRYQAFFLEPGQPQVVYEKGDYQLQQDTCLETQTYSKIPSKTTGMMLRYHYRIKNDTLTFSGVLPNGTTVQEYWKRVK